MKTKLIAGIAAAMSLIAVPSLHAQGLGFYGMEETIDHRTSFNIFDSKKIEFKEKLEISFRITAMPKSEFGYILRIKDFKNDRIWNMSLAETIDTVVLRLNQEGHYSVIKASIPKDKFKKLHWYDLGLDFDLRGKTVTLSINDRKQTARVPDLPDSAWPVIEFGKSDHMIDVPTFAIEDLHIKGGRHDIHYNLDECEGNYAYDEDWKHRGHVVNPKWRVNNSAEWKQIEETASDLISGATYNPVRKEFYYFDREHIEIFTVLTAQKMNIRFSDPCPVTLKLGNNFVSEDGRYLYCYELYDEFKAGNDASVARLDLDTYRWSVISTQNLAYPHHHHCGFINDKTGEYTIFGGFGDMLYNGTFWSLRDRNWQKSWPDNPPAIYPRYFTSCGTDGQYAYIFGGMGNESGEQIVGRQYFYDLHQVDLQTGNCRQMWDLDWHGDNLVPVRNLIIRDGWIYTLCYPEYISESYLKLYRFSIEDGSWKSIGSTIPIISNKMRTNANLHYDKELNMYFAIVQEFEDDIKSTVKVYSLLSPAIDKADLKVIPFRYKHRTASWCLGISTLVLLATILLTLFIRSRKRQDEENAMKSSGRRLFKAKHPKNSILLFGDFMVTDRKGENITALFTAQQRLILCMLFKYHSHNGISTRRLSNILWPDKDEEKVKNSRGVALNNLRKSLSNIDGVSIVFSDGRYRLETTPEFYCDYLELSKLVESEEQDMDHILNILSEGKFLKFMNDPIMDSFKEEVENKIAPLLDNELQKRYDLKEYQAVVEITRIIAFIDPIDEKSMKLSIWALKKQKRTEEALVCYATFCSEYKKMYDSDYPIKFTDL